jgi:hypothetical protein
MAEVEAVRVEIGFEGGEVLSARVTSKDADELEERLRARVDAVVDLAAEDGRYLVVLSRVLFVKRYAPQAPVGFGRG